MKRVDQHHTSSGVTKAQSKMPRSESTRSPQQIGRFEITQQVSQTEHLAICVGWDPRFDREVIIKSLSPSAFRSTDDQLKFQEQTRDARILSHPSIIPVVGFGKIESRSFIAYERCPGITLTDWLKQQSLPMEPMWTAVLVQFLADAVQHAHQRNLYHGGLSLSNIQIDPPADPSQPWEPEQVRIMNYGWYSPFVVSGSTAPSDRNISDGNGLASRSEDHRQDVASDLRALGWILFELLVGGQPAGFGDQGVLLELIKSGPNVDAEMSSICLKCMGDPNSDRYETAFELADQLIHWQVAATRSGGESADRKKYLPWSR